MSSNLQITDHQLSDYSTSRALLHNNTGERLANFFWRIWSNPAISNSIPGSTVARLFMTMSEGGNRVRTTPIPSPRSTPPPSRDTTPTPSSPQALAEPFPPADVADTQTSTSSSNGTISEPACDVADTHAPSARSRPTLKTTGSISDSPSASCQSPTSLSGTTSPISPTNAGGRSSSNGNRKRASYVTAGGARAKTRPSLPKRKGSQGPSLAVAESKKSPRTVSRKSPPRSPPLKQAQAEPTISKVTAIVPPPGLPSIPCKSCSFEQQPSFPLRCEVLTGISDDFTICPALGFLARCQLTCKLTGRWPQYSSYVAATFVLAGRYKLQK
jgi:hypothetical protein